MNKTTTGVFDAFNKKAALFQHLKDENPMWWQVLVNDADLYIDIRKDNYINVYYFGGCLAKIHYSNKNGYVMQTHRKYMGETGRGYVDSTKEIVSISRINSIKDAIRKVYLKESESILPCEKKIQGLLRCKRSSYIDSEFAYKKDRADMRMDLMEIINGKLTCIELKRIDDPRLLTKDLSKAEIEEQMGRFYDFLRKNSEMMLTYYQGMAELKFELGITKELMQVTQVDITPRLLIVDVYGSKLTSGRINRISNMRKYLDKSHISYEIIRFDEI